jgi:hypothetical protein
MYKILSYLQKCRNRKAVFLFNNIVSGKRSTKTSYSHDVLPFPKPLPVPCTNATKNQDVHD